MNEPIGGGNRLLCAWMVLLLGSRLAASCPQYDDTHRGFSDYYLVALENFYYALYYPGDSLTNREARGTAAYARARAAETHDGFAPVLDAYRLALRDLNGFSKRYSEINLARDRVDLLASLDDSIDPALVRRYFSAHDGHQVAALRQLVEGGTAVSDNAAYALAAITYDDGDVHEGVAQFERFQIDYPTSEKCDAAAYRSARGRLAMLQALPSDLGAIAKARQGFQSYLERFAEGHYRAEALGWLAFLLLHDRDDQVASLDWSEFDGGFAARKGDRTTTVAAVKIYLSILDQPELHGMFLGAVGSLRFGLRQLREDPPDFIMDDARHAAAFLFHAVTDRSRWDDHQPDDDARFARMLALAKRNLAQVAIGPLPPAVLTRLAQSYCQIGDHVAAFDLARASLERERSAETLYLCARCLVDLGHAHAADRLCDELLRDHPEFSGLGELILRLGGAFENLRQESDALRLYIAGDADDDIAILTDGEISIDELKQFVDAHPVLNSRVAKWSHWALGLANEWKPRDYAPMIRDRLGVRLARVGRYREALTYLDVQRKLRLEELLQMQAAADRAPPAAKPAADYALAAFWYHHGQDIVFNGPSWQQFYMHAVDAPAARGIPLPAADLARREANLLAMTTYLRAQTLFLDIAARYPSSPEAPKALYSAAACSYWLCGETYLHDCPYWSSRSKRDHLWEHGDALMRRLQREYPDHPLAKSEWVRKLPTASTGTP